MTRRNWLALSILLFTIVIIILANSGHLPRAFRDLYDFPHGDKVGHFLLMGALSFALNSAALASRVDTKPATLMLIVNLTLVVFVALEEFSQQLFYRRTFSLMDLAFSYAGIIFFAWLAARLKK